MVAIIIGPSVNSGATGTGLSVTTGLSFGIGLILGFSGFTGIQFNGRGAIVPAIIYSGGDAATFAGTGGLGITLSGPLADAATFGGTSSLSYLGSIGRVALAALPGTSALTANAIKALSLIAVEFDGSGVVTPSLAASVHYAGLATFAGTGSLSTTTTQFGLDTVTFGGVGSFTAIPFPQQLAATFPGTSTLTGNAIKAITAIFAGSGSLSATVMQTMQTSFNFAGTSKLSAYWYPI